MSDSQPIRELITKSDEARKRVCNRHGTYESRNLFNTIWTTCPKCEAEREAKKLQLAKEAIERQRLEVQAIRLKNCGIPDFQLKARRFDTFIVDAEAETAYNKALRFADSVGNLTGMALIMAGAAGTGKTHLAQAITQRAIERNVSAHYVTFSELITDKMFGWKDGLTPRGFENRYMKSLLVIDELDERIMRDGWQIEFFDIIDALYARRRNLCIISNSSIGDVREFIGHRIYDRLREMSAIAIKFDWESKRGKL